MRVLGIDPGLTRCGVGIVEVAANRTATLIGYWVIRTAPDSPLEDRLLAVALGIDKFIAEYKPDAIAVERVFAQHNVRTVMGTAQVSGIAVLAAARLGIPVGMHTPSEIKAAITGYGSAEKKQVGFMVARILKLDAPPQPADAADALALAICHAWRRATPGGVLGAALPAKSGSGGVGGSLANKSAASLTPAQKAWRAAEQSSARSVAPRKLTG